MRFVDLTGQRFGRLVVVERAPSRNSKTYWLCRCDCGGTPEVPGVTLRRARPTRSCGCLERERQIDRTSLNLACARPTTQHPDGRTGKSAGYMAHYLADQPACEPCLEGVRQANADKAAADPNRILRMNLWGKYRLSLERYEQLLADQGGRCAICLVEGPRDIRTSRFHVDHDHSCCPGKTSCGQCVRGLLCHACNTALGNFADDRERLMRAVQYLDRSPNSRPLAAELKPRTPRKAVHGGA